MVIGASASSMDLELFSVTDKFLQKMDDNDALLGSYAVDDDSRIHVCSCLVQKHFSYSVLDHCHVVNYS